MGEYLQLFVITATTVGKIMLCAVAGMFASRYFASPEKSEKGLSYISVRILLPCLLFSNLCLSVSVESIRRFYWAPLLACVPLSLGLASSFLFRVILEKKYHALIMLGCTFQNGLTFPLSIILNLKGISWLDKKAVDEAQSYIFLYNIICSIGLWAVGEPLIAAAKAKELEAQEETSRNRERAREQRLDHLRGVSTDDMANRSFALPFQEAEMAVRVRENSTKEGKQKQFRDVTAAPAASHTETGTPSYDNLTIPPSPPSSPCTTSRQGQGQTITREGTDEAVDGYRDAVRRDEETCRTKRAATATEQLAWYKPAKPYDHPIKPPKPAIVYTDEHGHVVTLDPEEDEAVKRNRCSMSRISGIFIRSFTSPTVCFSLIALFVSLVPPLRWVAASFGGQTIIGGLTVVGSGAIPLQLLVLGCTIVSSKPKEEEVEAEEERDNEAAQPPPSLTDANGEVIVAVPSKKSRWMVAQGKDCIRPSTLFIVCSVTLRMVVLPAVCFLVIHLLNKAGVLPNERPFLIAMLVATSSPSAINSSVICSMHDYYSKEYARMIFFMYIASIFSTAVYLFFYILYLGWE